MLKYINRYQYRCPIVLCAFISTHGGYAQDSLSTTKYFISYSDKLVFRLYLDRKFAPFTISSNNKEDLNYKTNPKLNLGAGFTYNYNA